MEAAVGTAGDGAREEVIRTVELTKVYAGADFAAVAGLNLSVHRGEIFGLLGGQRRRRQDDHRGNAHRATRPPTPGISGMHICGSSMRPRTTSW
jgi:hypothetical protein